MRHGVAAVLLLAATPVAAVLLLAATPVAAVLLLAATPVAAAQPAGGTASVWAFRKPITVPALERPGLVELRLDADVAREASPTLADLRVRDAHGADVPYAVRRRERATAEAARDVAMLGLVATPEGAVRFVLDAGAGRIVHSGVRLRIREQARSFRVPVRVETAEDGRAWHLAREAGFIYRVEGETKAARTSVSYPTSTARWLRVTVGAERGRALPLAGAAVVLAAPGERDEERVAASIVERDEESMRRTTRLVVDLRARRPVDRVELDVAERAFHRVVLIEASDDRKSWRPAGSGALSAVEFGKVRERLTGVRFPEAIARYLRLTIQNLDEPRLTVTGARVFSVKRTIVFEAAPGRTYLLDYGNPSATAPRYERTRALAQLGDERLPEARLGTIQRVPVPPPAPWLASRPIVVGASLAMTVLTFGSLLWRMARGVRAGL